ncbi:LysR substrate-binding domain-containing protein [Mesorhizobium yinganensis]|uniref:LysR substrate-binding domain-containing protein n=1 Tax=Mesorhizobium yinganensis TaxID=3157707 RepID=UPI0032B865FB
MSSLRQSIPSLVSLISFEAAARLLSFTKAADELNITQAAISRQIRELENFLQVALFERGHRSIELTSAGLMLNGSLPAHLTAIASISDRIRELRDPQVMVVGTTYAFGTYWLAPRLAEFSKLNPDVDLRLAVNDELVDITKQRIDMTIRFGGGNWPSMSAKFLIGCEIEPVCHPSYWQGRQRPFEASDLLGEMLLGIEGTSVQGGGWSDWFASQGVDTAESKHQITVNSFSVLIQAALSGHGIALGGSPLVDDLFASGVLVPAMDMAPYRVRASNYYVVEPLGQVRKQSCEKFCNWLYDRIRRDAAATGTERLLTETFPSK